MGSIMLSMENAIKRLAGAPEDHATSLKRRRKPPASSAMNDSMRFRVWKVRLRAPNGDPPKPGGSVEEDVLLNEIAQDFQLDKKTDPKVDQKLADIVNKRWGSKLEEAKLKEKLAKYNQSDNCEKFNQACQRYGISYWDMEYAEARDQELGLTSCKHAKSTCQSR